MKRRIYNLRGEIASGILKNICIFVSHLVHTFRNLRSYDSLKLGRISSDVDSFLEISSNMTQFIFNTL